MRSRGRLPVVAAAAVLAVIGVGCGDDPVGVAATTTTVAAAREPLSDPPDAGPVPTEPVLDEVDLATLGASVVRVSGVACGRLQEGSGVAVADDLVATGAHVVVGLPAPEVELVDGRVVPGTVVAFDGDADVALVRIEGAVVAPLPLGEGTAGAEGVVLGWEVDVGPEPAPFRIDRPITVRIESVGTTTRVERPSWLVAARIDPGDSGAALVDRTGTVVGLAYATTRRDAGVAYAVRSSEVADLVAAGVADPVAVPDC